MPELILSDYFYGDEAEQFIYFRIPRQLITNPKFKHVSTDAKLLYGMLLDRMGLSVRSQWYDDDGRVFIYYTVEEICDDMTCGRDKAMKLLAELDTGKGIGLIERVKQGQGKPTKIYVKRFTTGTVTPKQKQTAPPRHPEVDFFDVQRSELSTSRSRDHRRPEVGKSDPSNNNLNQTDFSHTDRSIYPVSVDRMDRCECRARIEENIGYDALKQQHPYDDLDNIVDLLTDVVISTAATVRIGGEHISMSVVRERFLKLDMSHIEYVLECLRQTKTEIRNIRAYLLTALYNALVTIGPYYSAAVRHDYG